MNPGKYRHKIKFLQQKLGEDGKPHKDAYGESIDEWEEYTTAWAAVDPLLGKEFFSALTTDNKVEIKFNSRYIPGITNAMRIQHGTEVYEIIGPPIDVKSLHRELLCYCRLVK